MTHIRRRLSARQTSLNSARARCRPLRLNCRNPSPLLITHSAADMLRQFVYGLALGWEDLNDHGALRCDVAMQTAVGVDREVASSPTLCRLEKWADPSTAWRLHAPDFQAFAHLGLAAFDHQIRYLINSVICPLLLGYSHYCLIKMDFGSSLGAARDVSADLSPSSNMRMPNALESAAASFLGAMRDRFTIHSSWTDFFHPVIRSFLLETA